jgi:hypothetical protein
MSSLDNCLIAMKKGFAGRVAQVVEGLPSKPEALSSNSHAAKKKNEINRFPGGTQLSR